METKLCKYCQTEIPKKAKVCPNCRKKQGGIGKWIIIVVVFMFIFALLGSGEEGEENNSEGSSTSNTGSVENEKDSEKNSEKESQKTPEDDKKEESKNSFSVGDVLETSDLKISYLSCEIYTSDNMFLQPKDGYTYYRLEFECENIGKSDAYVSYYDFDGYADGYAVEQTYFEDALGATLSSGKKVKGAVYFEVPVDAKEVIAEYEISFWTEKKVVFVIK